MDANARRRAAPLSAVRVVLSVMMVALLVLSAASRARAQGVENLESDPPEVRPEPEVLRYTMDEEAETASTLLEVPVIEDTYIASNLPDTNFGASNWLRLGYSADPPNLGAVRVLMRFDIDLIPEDARIESAECRVYQHTTTLGPDDPKEIKARHLAEPWEEPAVTWNNHLPDWGGIIRTVTPTTTVGWLSADATDLVREWHSGEHANYGIHLLAYEEVGERQRIFYAREADNGLYPRLLLTYTTKIDVEPPNVDVQSLPEWSTSNFTVRWSGDDPGGSGIDYYDVQYRVPDESWTTWLNNTEATSAEFAGGANGTVYEFRARGVDNAANVEAWPDTQQAWTRVDAIAPAASVNTLPPVTFSESFVVSWDGSDNTGGSGIDTFDVQYRPEGKPWRSWFVGTEGTAARFTGARHGATYQFRARARDTAGNVQPWSGSPQAETTIDLQEPTARIEPFATSVISDTEFLVRWDGTTSTHTTLAHYDIRYRYDYGAWEVWLTDTELEQSLFDELREADGQYCFEARATDSAGRTGPYGGGACMIVDRKPPFIEPRAYLPLIFRNATP